MKHKLLKVLKKEDGISLVEVVASVTLISIILISFFGILIQSSKTGKTSSDIVDATYIAQTELEKIYSLYTKPKIKITDALAIEKEITDDIKSIGYSSIPAESNSTDVDTKQFFFTKEIDSTTKIELSAYVNINRKSIIHICIDVFQNKVPKASMENAYRWGDEF